MRSTPGPGHPLAFCLLLLMCGLSCRHGTEVPRTPTPEPAGTAALDWIQKNTRPLSSVDPDAPHNDLAALSPWFAERTLVAMGEATHGTKEFFQLKHRFFRYLVQAHQFTTLAMEIPYAVALRTVRTWTPQHW